MLLSAESTSTRIRASFSYWSLAGRAAANRHVRIPEGVVDPQQTIVREDDASLGFDGIGETARDPQGSEIMSLRAS
jgi:hypothetical protein